MKYGQAEPLLEQTLAIQRRVLGPEHPSALITMTNLASAYSSDGKYDQSEELGKAKGVLSDALETERLALGSGHPSTLLVMNELALVDDEQGKFVRAESLAQEMVEAEHNKRPGESLLFSAESELDASLAGQKRYSQAEPLLLEKYQGMDRLMKPGESQSDLLEAGEGIVLLYWSSGRFEKATARGQQLSRAKSVAVTR